VGSTLHENAVFASSRSKKGAAMSTAKSSKADPSATSAPEPLALTDLCNLCHPESLNFKTTEELPDLQDVIGQPRAIRALELGSEVSGQGYNTFVLGMPGSGRTTLSREYLERKALKEMVPDDWCYINNFEHPRQPQLIRLPPGRASEFGNDLDGLIEFCKREISQKFESKEYSEERDRLVKQLKKNQEAEFIRLQEKVEKFNFLLARTPFGFALVPGVEGKPIKPEDLEKLSPEKREKLNQLQSQLGGELEKTLSQLRELEAETKNKLEELDRQTVLFLIDSPMKALRSKYDGWQSVSAHLDVIQQDIIENADKFRAKEASDPGEYLAKLSQEDWTLRYRVNVLVDNSETSGAPVVVESHPSYTNLLGRIEQEVVMGAARTNFTMIRAGAFHRANGGYLVIPARDLLVNPYAWEGIKRVLRDGEIRLVELSHQMGLASNVTLEPEPVPLAIKVVLVGTPTLYYLLRAYDEDFAKLFKVRAEFGTSMDRTPETENEYGIFVKSVVEDHRLPPFDRTAVARIIEYSSRLAENQNKLTTRFGIIADLIRESAYWSRKDDLGEADRIVTVKAVNRAIDESIYRSNLIEERIQELIANGTLLIDVTGAVVGQVNALSVAMLGDYSFGRPSRVTASAFPGKGVVVDVERQAKLGGPIHTKGVLILNGLLGWRYGGQSPLSLSASLTFEQSYDEVEGDSASTAELLALLSAIADVPLRQDRAVTGSINQHGRVQAIGGVNEKIEGFYISCKTKGLTGEQGVLIPYSNIKNLMLHQDVLEAVENGQFHIWPISTIEDGLALLTDMEPGELQDDGSYPEGTFNHAVMVRLAEFAKAGQPEAEEGQSSEGNDQSNKNVETEQSKISDDII
jgi:lon-related putative ATP-dependent protease